MKKQKYVYAQKPNLPLIVWFGSFILTKIPFLGKINPLLELVSFGAIFTWAWMEIFKGVNNFRKLLGIIVMIIILYSRLIT